MKKIKGILGVLGIIVIMILFSGITSAAPGDLIKTVTVPVPSQSCCGIGIEYDGTNVLYTNYQDGTIYKTNLNGDNLGSIPLTNPDGTPFTHGLNAIAYRVVDGYLYGGAWDSTNLYKTDLSTGITTLVKANAVPLAFGFIDGLSWDPRDDTFWMSDDVQCNVEQLDTSGNDIGGFNGCDVTGLSNSGLAVGLNGPLWYGTNGAGQIYQIDTSVVPPGNLGVFASPGGRDEDMSCGPEYTKEDGSVVETLLSKDAYDNTFAVIEVAPETCISPAGVLVNVEKDFRFTEVNFAPIDPITGEKLPAQLGELLPDADGDGKFDVKYVLKTKDGTVSSTNPGQLYAVKTIKGETVDVLHIDDSFGTQFDVNPAQLGGGIEVIRVDPDGFATILTDTGQVTATVDNNANTVDIDIDLDTPLGEDTLMIYVKFKTTLKDLLPDYSDFVNHNEVVIEGQTIPVDATVEFV